MFGSYVSLLESVNRFSADHYVRAFLGEQKFEEELARVRVRGALRDGGLVAEHDLSLFEGTDPEHLGQSGLFLDVLENPPGHVPHVHASLAGDQHLHFGLGPGFDDGLGFLELLPETENIEARLLHSKGGKCVAGTNRNIADNGFSLELGLNRVPVGDDFHILHAGAGGVPNGLERIGQGYKDFGVFVVLPGSFDGLDVIFPLTTVEFRKITALGRGREKAGIYDDKGVKRILAAFISARAVPTTSPVRFLTFWNLKLLPRP